MASSDNEENMEEGHWLKGLVKPSAEEEDATSPAPPKPLKPGKRRPGAGQSAPRQPASELTPMEPMAREVPSESTLEKSVPEAVTERTTSSLSTDRPGPPLRVAPKDTRHKAKRGGGDPASSQDGARELPTKAGC